MTCSTALNLAWANANVLDLQSPKSPIYGVPLTDSQIGLVFSLVNIGALCGNLICLWAVEKFGRKKTMAFTALPNLVRFFLTISFLSEHNFTFLFYLRTFQEIF